MVYKRPSENSKQHKFPSKRQDVPHFTNDMVAAKLVYHVFC